MTSDFKRIREAHKRRMSLPSVSWPRQMESSSRERIPVAKELGHLTRGRTGRLAKYLPTIFTTAFHRASSCRKKKDTTTHQCGPFSVARLLRTGKDSHRQGLRFSRMEDTFSHVQGASERWREPAELLSPSLLQKPTLNTYGVCVLTAHSITRLS